MSSAVNGRLHVDIGFNTWHRPPYKTAEVIPWVVRFHDDDGADVTDVKLEYGDGSADTEHLDPVCNQNQHYHGDGFITEREPSYRRPGSYRFTATITTGACGHAPTTVRVTSDALTIEPGPTPSNGPSAARVIAAGADDEVGPTPPEEWAVKWPVLDRDGYVSRVEIRWGDGATEVQEFPLSDCSDPGRYWPTSERVVRSRHTFATQDWTKQSVGFFVTSVGCDGATPQTGSGGITRR